MEAGMYEELRPKVFGVAYRMLGGVSEAGPSSLSSVRHRAVVQDLRLGGSGLVVVVE
jgi:hypothetical protein